MTSIDMTQIIGFYLGAFVLGYTSTLLIRIFKRAAHSIR